MYAEKEVDPFLVRNLVYGVEDSLVSTAGVVIGTSWAGLAARDVVVAGTVLVLVESLSMAFGSFISEDSFMTRADIDHDWLTVSRYAVIMFSSYVAAGGLVLLPFALQARYAWQWSAGLSLAALWTLMYAYQKESPQRHRKAAALTSVAAVILAISVFSGNLMRS